MQTELHNAHVIDREYFYYERERELIVQLYQAGAPDSEIAQAEWYAKQFCLAMSAELPRIEELF